MQDNTTRVEELSAKVLRAVRDLVGGGATPASTFDSLGFDDIEFLELVLALENDLGITLDDSDLDGVRTAGDLTALVVKEVSA